MQKLFHNILVPVTLHRATVAVLSNSIDLANKLECNLHILYLARPPVFPGLFHASRKRKIAALQQEVSDRLRPGLLMNAVFAEGQADSELRTYLLSHDVDMVYLPELQENHWPFSMTIHSGKLALEGRCAVIHGVAARHWGNCDRIVLPVEQSVPINSLRTGVYLAQHFKATIHLVSEKMNGEEQAQSLARAYQLLKAHTELPVVCDTFEGLNFREAVVEYARKIQAGLIVANLAYRTTPGFFSRLFSREFAAARTVPVMVVE